MKNRISLLFLFCITLFFTSCKKEPTLTILPNTLTIEVGEFSTLVAVFEPASESTSIYWTSSNSEIASVEPGSGVVMGKAAGTVTITATNNTLTATATVNVTKKYKVGDLYVNGTDMGIVYTISDGGTHGKIISLFDFFGSWSSTKILTNATNQNDGSINMATIRALDQNFSNYPVFKDCNELLGHGWYIPAENELAEIYQKLTLLQTSLTANGGDRFYTEAYPQSGSFAYYWTSTEKDQELAGVIAFSGFFIGTQNATKTNRYYARPIKKF